MGIWEGASSMVQYNDDSSDHIVLCLSWEEGRQT